MRKALDEERKSNICAILSIGGTRTMAAYYAGCHPRTIYNEARRDPIFAERIRRNELKPEIMFLKTVIDAGTEGGQWRAARWALERMYPTRYAARNPRLIAPEEVRSLLEEVVAVFAKSVTGAGARRRLRTAVAELEARTTAERPARRLSHAH